ncbi:MAG: transposase [Candidatus Omnitrophica bacterium]|nr:transposase [Candidatus Omnitrophota bacterium]
MPRGPRQVYKNAFLSITSRGNNKRVLFRKEKDYKYFAQLLLRYKIKHKFKLYHYCIMRNHLHLLLQIKDSASLAKIMQGMQLAYFHYFRKRYGYVGRLWQGRFYSKLIEDDKYLLTAGLYMEKNPVRAGIVKDPKNYAWSSYNCYAFGIKNQLVDYDFYYLKLGITEKKRESEYREIMGCYIQEMENHTSLLVH